MTQDAIRLCQVVRLVYPVYGDVMKTPAQMPDLKGFRSPRALITAPTKA